MLKIVICEDNKDYLKLIKSYILKILKTKNIIGEIVCEAEQPSEAEAYLNHFDANVLFFDINFHSDQTGYDLALKIRQKYPDAYLVFISEHLEYVLQSFKARPFDFLPKPVTINRLSVCLESIWNDYCRRNISCDTAETIQIKFGSTIYYVRMSEIVFIAAYGNKLEVHTLNGVITCYETLKNFENKLIDNRNFIRCHKSFLVNSYYIKEIRLKEMEIHMSTGDICFIGKNYKRKFLESVNA